jgi:signal peptidase I
MKKIRKCLFLVVVALIIIFSIYLKFSFNIYRVSSESMIPTLLQYDLVLVKKIRKGIFQKSTSIIRGKTYVFKIPYIESNKEYNSNHLNNLFIKRIVGCPGDTLQIEKNTLYINSKVMPDYVDCIDINSIDKIRNVYDADIKKQINENNFFEWNNGDFGNFYIPKKDKNIIINDSLMTFYKDIFLFETRFILDASLNKTNYYAFKHNYYFVMGDNRAFSMDSRHFGPIPESVIIGEATHVLFSWSKNNPFFISRIFKKIQ